MTGIWCLIAARFRLGTFADFLSRPILQGLLNGVALTIIVSQIGKYLVLLSYRAVLLNVWWRFLPRY